MNPEKLTKNIKQDLEQKLQKHKKAVEKDLAALDMIEKYIKTKKAEQQEPQAEEGTKLEGEEQQPEPQEAPAEQKPEAEVSEAKKDEVEERKSKKIPEEVEKEKVYKTPIEKPKEEIVKFPDELKMQIKLGDVAYIRRKEDPDAPGLYDKIIFDEFRQNEGEEYEAIVFHFPDSEERKFAPFNIADVLTEQQYNNKFYKTEEIKQESETEFSSPEKVEEEKPEEEIGKEQTEILEDKERIERILKFGEIRKKLEEFNQARKELAQAEKKGKGVAEAREKYEKKKAEYVGEKLWRDLKEQERMTGEKAENFTKGIIRKFYEWSSNKYILPKDWIKKIEEWQPGSLVSENLIKKIQEWQPESRIGKAGKVSASLAAKLTSLKTLANIGIKLTSVRNIASYGLLGAGIAAGATGIGAGAAFGAIALRRGLAGVGTGFGMYNTLNRIVDWCENKKDIHNSLNEQELKNLSQKEIIDRLEYFEARARVRGQKVKELSDYQNYRNLKLELNKRFKENFEGAENHKQDTKEWLTKTRQQIDENLEEHYSQEKTKDRKIKAAAIGAGAFTALGGVRIAGKGIWDLVHGKGMSGFEKAGAQEFNAYKELFFDKGDIDEVDAITSAAHPVEELEPEGPPAPPEPSLAEHIDRATLELSLQDSLQKAEIPDSLKTAIQDSLEKMPTDSEKVALLEKISQGDTTISVEDLQKLDETAIAQMAEQTKEQISETAAEEFKFEKPIPETILDEKVGEYPRVVDEEFIKQEAQKSFEQKYGAAGVTETTTEVKPKIAEVYDGQIQDAAIKAGNNEGPTYAILRQLKAAPEKYGLDLNTSDKEFILKAREIAIKNDLIEVDKAGKIISETRSYGGDSYILNQDLKVEKIMPPGSTYIETDTSKFDYSAKPLTSEVLEPTPVKPEIPLKQELPEFAPSEATANQHIITNLEHRFENPEQYIGTGRNINWVENNAVNTLENYLTQKDLTNLENFQELQKNLARLDNTEILERLAQSENHILSHAAEDAKTELLQKGTTIERINNYLELKTPDQKGLNFLQDIFKETVEKRLSFADDKGMISNLFSQRITQSPEEFKNFFGSGAVTEDKIQGAWQKFLVDAESKQLPVKEVWQPRTEIIPLGQGRVKEVIFNVKPQDHLNRATDYLIDYGDAHEVQTISAQELNNKIMGVSEKVKIEPSIDEPKILTDQDFKELGESPEGTTMHLDKEGKPVFEQPKEMPDLDEKPVAPVSEVEPPSSAKEISQAGHLEQTTKNTIQKLLDLKQEEFDNWYISLRSWFDELGFKSEDSVRKALKKIAKVPFEQEELAKLSQGENDLLYEFIKTSWGSSGNPGEH